MANVLARASNVAAVSGASQAAGASASQAGTTRTTETAATATIQAGSASTFQDGTATPDAGAVTRSVACSQVGSGRAGHAAIQALAISDRVS